MNAYWQQWDRADLDSWQGKEIDSVQDEDKYIDGEDILESERILTRGLVDEYGLADWMFL
jgi:hypothetical protein